MTRIFRITSILYVPSQATSREAAAAQAAHDVLVNLFPAQQATSDRGTSNSLSSIPDGPAKTGRHRAGQLVGRQHHHAAGE